MNLSNVKKVRVNSIPENEIRNIKWMFERNERFSLDNETSINTVDFGDLSVGVVGVDVLGDDVFE